MVNLSNFKQTEKLIALIERRPELYDYTIKGYNDRDLNEKLWNEVADRMKTNVQCCKNKWMSLRSAYSRQIRIEKGTYPMKFRCHRKKFWYLSKNMEFLRIYMNHKNKDGSILDQSSSCDNGISDIQDETTRSFPFPIKAPPSPETSTTKIEVSSSPPKKFIEAKKIEYPQHTEEPENYCDEYFSQSKNRNAPDFDDHHLTFFKSILPDINKLSDRRQRLFKQNLLLKLNGSLDQQEMEF